MRSLKHNAVWPVANVILVVEHTVGVIGEAVDSRQAVVVDRQGRVIGDQPLHALRWLMQLLALAAGSGQVALGVSGGGLRMIDGAYSISETPE